MDERDYRALNKELKQQQSDVRYTVLPAVPYQCCPLCNGQGQTLTLAEGFTSVVYDVCKVCNGKRIIPMHVIEVINGLPKMQEECQTCKGTGRQPHTYRAITVACRECEGEGYIFY